MPREEKTKQPYNIIFNYTKHFDSRKILNIQPPITSNISPEDDS